MGKRNVEVSGRGTIRVLLAASVPLWLSMFLWGCGFIADPDMRKVAEMDGEVIRAGDLMRIIRNMTDEERPLIQNKGDLRRALDKYIDDKIKDEIAEPLLQAGRIQPNTEVATARYFAKYPEYQVMWQSSTDVDALTQQLNYQQGDLDAILYSIELGIGDEETILLREQALAYARGEAFSQGTLAIAEDEFSAEYAMRENELIHFEKIEFRAIRFPAAVDGASGQANRVMQRTKAGERFGEIVDEYKKRDAASVIEAGFENNPAIAKFKLFWGQVTGSKPGDIVGPIFLPPYTDIYDGRAAPMPGAFLVLEVLAQENERRKSLEEARNDIAPDILSRKIMQRLRDGHGVAIFSEGLPDPAGFGDQYKDSIIKTRIDQ